MKTKDDDKYRFEGKLFPRKKHEPDIRKRTKKDVKQQFVVPWQLDEKMSIK